MKHGTITNIKIWGHIDSNCMSCDIFCTPDEPPSFIDGIKDKDMLVNAILHCKDENRIDRLKKRLKEVI